ncbi:hypothetical protein BDV18DRAFT_50376 [Aspergillus unguis]
MSLYPPSTSLYKHISSQSCSINCIRIPYTHIGFFCGVQANIYGWAFVLLFPRRVSLRLWSYIWRASIVLYII